MLEDRYYFKDYYYVLWQSLGGDSLSAKPNANFVWNSEELWGGDAPRPLFCVGTAAWGYSLVF